MANLPSAPSDKRAAVDAFLEKIRTPAAIAPGTRGRLIFALDATQSRQPTWDRACQLQAEMFEAAAATAGLDIQLVYYRGLRECSASRWVSDARTLAALMEKIDCRGGYTQIGRVLAHARAENARQKVSALAFIGDAMEETPDDLYAAARELGFPVFMFQELDDPGAAKVFQGIAWRTKGAYCRFNPAAVDELRNLLRGVAAYAGGGLKALSSGNAGAMKLLEQLK